MPFHPLLLITYDRGLHWKTQKPKPYHWAFFVKTESVGDQVLGIAHQLHGMPGAFHYSSPEQVEMKEIGSKTLDLEIKSVEPRKLDRVTEIMKTVPVETSEASPWNCQDWSLAAVETLRKEGFIDDQYTNEIIKYWLRNINNNDREELSHGKYMHFTLQSPILSQSEHPEYQGHRGLATVKTFQ